LSRIPIKDEQYQVPDETVTRTKMQANILVAGAQTRAALPRS